MAWPAQSAAQGLSYSVDERGVPGLDAIAVAKQAAAAMTSWASVGCGAGSCAVDSQKIALKFIALGWTQPQGIGLGCQATGTDGKCSSWVPDGNQVLFVPASEAWPYGAHVLAMTIVTAQTNTGALVDADIAVQLANHVYCVDNCAPGEVHLGAVLQHEAGHMLGLDHSHDSGAVMFATAPTQISSLGVLQADDRLGACSLYSAGPPLSTGADCAGGIGKDGGDGEVSEAGTDPDGDSGALQTVPVEFSNTQHSTGCYCASGSRPMAATPAMIMAALVLLVLRRRQGGLFGHVAARAGAVIARSGD